MRIKRYIASLLFLAMVFQLSATPSKRVYLSGTGFDQTVNWEFFCTAGMKSGEWTSIAVPSCWEQEGFGAYSYGHVDFEERLKEEGHYRTTFVAEKDWKKQVVELVFEGVMTDARVLLNGKQAGEVHQGAFYPFSYDVSSLLRYGKENTLEVFVKKFSDNHSVNAAERKADYWIFGGIFRPVYLEVHPPAHIKNVAIDARADGRFTSDIFLSGLTKNALLEVSILDEAGGQIHGMEELVEPGSGKLRVSTSVEGMLPWSPEFPELYLVEYRLKDGKGQVLHLYRQKCGFRTVEVRAQDGIYVNGQRIKFKGVNRHSFHPDHGRTSSKAFSIEVVNLLKDMNMNAVRMSHYPPDRHFLDACDSLGLFVLDELAGWQKPPYDSVVGRKLLRAMIRRDVNHPSIVLWDNGNEGGWNTAYDGDFRELDIQEREVLHPWAVHGKINTAHYIDYNYLTRDHFAPRKIHMPTEFLHGLYDGGHGAGLEDYWLRMWNDPLSAGGFLWVFADEAVKRSDTGELDSDGNHAPDGILGPYLEKEGSFYSIREIWAPVHVEKRYLTPGFNGVFHIQNRFHYTTLDQVDFSYQWKSFPGPAGGDELLLDQGSPRVDVLKPGQWGSLQVPLVENWQEAQCLLVEAHDPHGRLIHRWSWPVQSPAGLAHDMTREEIRITSMVEVKENDRQIILEASGIRLALLKQNGQLEEVQRKGKTLDLGKGPVFRVNAPKLLELTSFHQDGNHHVLASYERDQYLEWIMTPTGLVDMVLHYHPDQEEGPWWSKPIHSTGAMFSFPEEAMRKVSLLAKGPYRVWKNREKGPEFGRWEKTYNNTITGHSGFEYPEFKGYYGNLYWATISNGKDPGFTVYSHTEDLFLKLLEPEEAPEPANTAMKHFPGQLGFMLAIPPMGTKFKHADQLGPQSGPYRYDPRRVEDGALHIHLSFDFRNPN